MTASVVVLTAFLLSAHIKNSLYTFNIDTASAAENTGTLWASFPGASVVGNSVHFTALDRKIVNQDGSGGQADPAVNVNGSHLQQTGDFDLSLTMSDLNGGDASFRLYRDAPIVYDEWRYDGVSAGFTVSGSNLSVMFWDGKHEGPVSKKVYNLNQATTSRSRTPWYRRWLRKSTDTQISTMQTASNARIITLQRRSNNLLVLVDEKQIASLPAGLLFTQTNLWFGADATGDGWTLDAMAIGGNASFEQASDIAESPAPASLSALAAAARPSLKVGAAVSLYPLMTDPAYRKLALSQFSIWTPENAMKAQFIHPNNSTYSFEQADALVEVARKNNIVVHGHALVFGEANATWMQKTPAPELKKVMEEHITTIMQHYAGKVAEWDVINEPLADYDTPAGTSGLRKSIWYNAMGESFIANALITAHKADPSAKLYINEYGLESDDDRWDMFVSLLQKLQAARVPLDGVGFQAHVYDDADTIDPAVLRRHIQVLKGMGLASRISEMDVHGEDANFQAQQYQAVLRACRNEQSCTSFSTWGIADKYGSTTSDHTYPPEYGNDLIWDSNLQTKPAFQALLTGLK